MQNLYKMQNVELCQTMADHFDGNVNFGGSEIHTIVYFLTHCKGKLKQICSANYHDDMCQIFIKSLRKRQSQYDNDNLILTIPHCKCIHQPLPCYYHHDILLSSLILATDKIPH